MDKRQRRAEGLWEQVLRESEKHNVMFLFRSQEEALSTANYFREAMSENVKDTADKTTLKTMAGSYIYFKDIQFLKKGVDGMKTKVIICMPILEYISVNCGGVCMLKQFIEQEE